MDGRIESVQDLYPPKWVTAADLDGKAVVVKIVRVDVETFHVPQINEKKTAAVLTLEGKTRRLILNKTQCRALARLCGSPRFKDWVGKSVALAPDRAPNGKPTIAILSPPPLGPNGAIGAAPPSLAAVPEVAAQKNGAAPRAVGL